MIRPGLKLYRSSLPEYFIGAEVAGRPLFRQWRWRPRTGVRDKHSRSSFQNVRMTPVVSPSTGPAFSYNKLS